MAQFGWNYNLTKCTGCRSCVNSCKHENNTPLGVDYRTVVVRDTGSYPSVTRQFVSIACNHCANPACMASCPVGAITKSAANGIVTIDRDKCVGCENCVHVCPYGAPHLNSDTKKTEKCTGCAHLRAANLLPACAANCVGRALEFKEDPTSIGDKPDGFASETLTNPSIHFDE